ncbi:MULTISPECIES: hypothetical protein [Planktothrix]|uniref:Transposase n=1 Tax=Planktothrix tepida PCC 9214 TaxID=671072 RepID=A0A1J1LNY0_9CYAN|nr:MULTISPECIES: hypothetical protein [Planktothrix]CUR33652.1 hypothetical protein PL9214520191 [Planktothrix tepida PCC 9214]
MIVLEYKVKDKLEQYKAIDQAIRTTQFVRNKAIRYWMDNSRELKIDKFALKRCLLVFVPTIDRIFCS